MRRGSLTNNATATSSNAGGDKAHATINVPKAKHGVKGKLKARRCRCHRLASSTSART